MKVKSHLRAGFGGETLASAAGLALEPANLSPLAPFPARSPGVRSTGLGNLLPFLVDCLTVKLRELLDWWQASRNPAVEVIDLNRWWEIDAFRGVALAMMLLMHAGKSWLHVVSGPASDALMQHWPMLKFGVSLPIIVYLIYQATASHRPLAEPRALGWWFLGEMALWGWAALWLSSAGSGATAFLYLMGLSMAITARRAEPDGTRFDKWLRRGLMLLALGMGVTLLSVWVLPQMPIQFGILHLLGLSTLLAYPFLSLPAWAVSLSGAGVVGVSALLQGLAPVSLGWLWLGIPVTGLASVDYAPLLPWFGAVLLGLATGKGYIAARENGQFTPPDFSHTPLGRGLAWLGRHSLAVYLLQTPLFLTGMAVG
jgi:uncharacterized membrane protein